MFSGNILCFTYIKYPKKYSGNQDAISKWQKCNKNGKKLVPESIHYVIVLSCGQMAIGQIGSDFTKNSALVVQYNPSKNMTHSVPIFMWYTEYFF